MADKGEDQVLKAVIETVDKLAPLIKSKAMEVFVDRLGRCEEKTFGELGDARYRQIVFMSVIDGMEDTASVLRKELGRIDREVEFADKEKLKDKQGEEFAKSAADRAFPGVKDD